MTLMILQHLQLGMETGGTIVILYVNIGIHWRKQFELLACR
jgi:hypothetical protein